MLWQVVVIWPNRSTRWKRAHLTGTHRAIARLRYSEGVAEYFEILNAECNLFSALQRLLAIRPAWLNRAARAQEHLFFALV